MCAQCNGFFFKECRFRPSLKPHVFSPFARNVHTENTQTQRVGRERDGWNGADIKIKNEEKERDGYSVSESMSNSSSGLTRRTHVFSLLPL